MPDAVYFDSCLFIELLQQSDQERFDACEGLRAKAEVGEIIIVTSALTITEVNKLKDSPELPEVQSRIILAFFENPYIAIRPLDRGIAEYAHELTRTNKLSNNDAIHVATAIKNKVPVLYTYDSKKGKPKGLTAHHLKIGNPPLRIEIPPDPDDQSLFSKKAIEDNKVDPFPSNT